MKRRAARRACTRSIVLARRLIRSSRSSRACIASSTAARSRFFSRATRCASGYHATIYTYNITVFDPTWFTGPDVDIAERLRGSARQEGRPAAARDDGYLEFLRLGGRLRFVDLSPTLIRRILRRRFPIITGLCSTYLYRAARELGANAAPDDVRGMPVGPFRRHRRLRRRAPARAGRRPLSAESVRRRRTNTGSASTASSPRSCSASSRTTRTCSSSIRRPQPAR